VSINPFAPREYACTVVSLLPIALREEKPHMLPSTFIIQASSKGDFSILHVGEGIHWIPNPLVEEGKPNSSFRQITSPGEMARSICEDYKYANISISENAEPGLFWVHGKLMKDEIRKHHSSELAIAEEKQKNWFRNLVALADADWNKNHNMLAVSDLQRKAAEYLGVNKEWVKLNPQETVNCPFCTIPIPTFAIICPNCKQVVNDTEFNKVKGTANPIYVSKGE